MIVLGEVVSLGAVGSRGPGVPGSLVCHKKTVFGHSLSVVGPVSGWVNLCRDLIVSVLVTAVPWYCLIGQPVLSGS